MNEYTLNLQAQRWYSEEVKVEVIFRVFCSTEKVPLKILVKMKYGKK